MVPLVIQFVPMVMPMVPLALPMVQLVPLVSQWYHWLPMVPLVKLPMVPLGEPRTEPLSSFDKFLVSSVFVGVNKVHYRLSAYSSCHVVIDHHNETSLQTTIMHIDHHDLSPSITIHHHHNTSSSSSRPQHIITPVVISPFHNSTVLIIIIYHHQHQHEPSHVTFTHLCIFIYGGITQ